MLQDRKIRKTARRINRLIEVQLIKDNQNGKTEYFKGMILDTDETKQKTIFLDYLGKVLKPKDHKFLELPQIQDSLIKKGLNFLKEIENN